MFFKKKPPTEFKRWHGIALLIVVLLGLGSYAYSFYWPTAKITISNKNISKTYTVLVADTFRHEFQGLSGRNSLGKYDGMLFVFPTRAVHAMVMRDMRFALDIVWVDGDTIVHIEPNLPLEPGKSEAELKVYGEGFNSTKVLEFSAGFTQSNGIMVGDTLVVRP